MTKLKQALITGSYLIVLTLFLLSVLASYVNPNTLNISAFGLFFPYIMLPAILFLVFFIKTKRAQSLPLLILVVYGLLNSTYYFQFGLHEKGNSGADSFSIMSFNLMIGTRFSTSEQANPQVASDQFLSLLDKNPPTDVFCGQELGSSVYKLISDSGLFPYVHRLPKRTAAIFSKYPFVDFGEVDIGATINSCLWADLQLGNDTIRVYSVHLESNKLKPESFNFLLEDEYESSRAVNGIVDLVMKYSHYAPLRTQQAMLIKSHSKSSPYPVIIAGDFNEGPMSYTYRVLKRGLEDSFLEKGSGLGSTWNGDIPLLRIDYILHDPMLAVNYFETTRNNLSDHYPIKTVFTLK